MITGTSPCSVALCTYNGAEFLEAQLDSIARQTVLPAEVIVTDDGSQDGTLVMLDRFRREASFPVLVYERLQPVGPTANFSDTLGRCSGDLILLCDQDDVWLEDKIESFRRLFVNEQPLLAFSDAELIGPRGEALGDRLWSRLGVRDRDLAALSTSRAVSQLLHKSMVTGAAAAVHRDLVMAAGPIPTHLGVLHDGWLALVAACLGRVSWTRRPLMHYRQHSGQWTGAPLEGAARTSMRPGVRLTTRYDFALQRSQAEALLAKMAELRVRGVDGADSAPEDFLRSHIQHLDARSALGGGWPDPAVVMRELLSHRYSKHSQGLRSAAKDLALAMPKRRSSQADDDERPPHKDQ